jgi:NADH dehydrogenase
LGNEILTLCEPYPVIFHHETTVNAVFRDKVTLSNGLTLDADLTIWTGGAKAPDILYQSGLSPKVDQWAPVMETLQSCFYEDVFVVGDAAKFTTPIGKQAYHAMDMGTLAAENIARKISGRPLKTFFPAEKPMLISFGDLTTFLASDSAVLSGASLAGIKEGIYQYTMVKMDSLFGIRPIWDLYQRSKTGAYNFLTSSMTPLSALKRFSDIRMLE